MTRRVVITGMAAISPIGCDVDTMMGRLREGKGGVARMAEWEDIPGLQTRLAAPAEDFQQPKLMGRRQTRTMGRVALLSTVTSEWALSDAGLLDDPQIQEKMGVAYGSSAGGMDAIARMGQVKTEHSLHTLQATTYVKMMAHTCAANISIYFKLTGRMIPTSSACTSGSQALGYAYETIKHGYQTMMLAGGAEELSLAQVGVFDIMFAYSTQNNRPEQASRPFDQRRDGLVVGEAATSLILEEYEHAKARGAHIYAEVVGFSTNSNGTHVTQPDALAMTRVMEGALENAGLAPEAIGYINAHATATEIGDIIESQATHQVFGSRVPISSIKGYTGHTLGASGAFETMLSTLMMNQDWYAPNLNLIDVDPRCAELNYITGSGRSMQHEYVMNNSFAFGGVNTSLILKRLPEG